MIVYPNSKINLGLNIISKRNNGFHNLQSVFYPIKLTDILEVNIASKNVFELSGMVNNIAKSDDNLIIKAYKLLKSKYPLPSLNIHLHKSIPVEAGIGGGSADAAYILVLLNKMFKLNISNKNLLTFADELGSDVSFFINNKPSFVTGKGEQHKYLPNFLKGKYLVLIKPNISISTVEAFKNISISEANININNIENIPINKWSSLITNDFEKYAFNKHTELSDIKNFLYAKGADYASMSGSGSAIYGIFNKNPNITDYINYFVWNEIMS